MLICDCLAQTSKKTARLIPETNTHKIFVVVLAVVLSLALGCAVNPCFANSDDINTSGVVITAAVGTIGLTAIIIGLLNKNGSNDNNRAISAGAPTVTGVSPSTGPLVGGTTVTITGTGFTDVIEVTIGGTSVTSFTVVSDTSIIATTPAGIAGSASVLVTTSGGTNPANAYYNYYTLGIPIGGGILISINSAPASGSRQLLIMAKNDQSTGVEWATSISPTSAKDGYYDRNNPGACPTEYTCNHIGSGSNSVGGNTYAIFASIGSAAAPAALTATNYVDEEGHDDWYLPSMWELDEMYTNGGIAPDAHYWSSTEYVANAAWYQNFSNGDQNTDGKGATLNVRAVRAINY